MRSLAPDGWALASSASFSRTGGLRRSRIGSSKQTVSELPVLLAFKKPTTATTLVVGDKVLKRRTEAEAGMKTMKVCTN